MWDRKGRPCTTASRVRRSAIAVPCTSSPLPAGKRWLRPSQRQLGQCLYRTYTEAYLSTPSEEDLWQSGAVRAAFLARLRFPPRGAGGQRVAGASATSAREAWLELHPDSSREGLRRESTDGGEESGPQIDHRARELQGARAVGRSPDKAGGQTKVFPLSVDCSGCICVLGDAKKV